MIANRFVGPRTMIKPDGQSVSYEVEPPNVRPNFSNADYSLRSVERPKGSRFSPWFWSPVRGAGIPM